MIQIDPIQFLMQAAALVGWILAAAIVVSVVERAVSGLNERDTTLLTAYALWFFLGIVGAHRIFCRRIMSGLGQLALTFGLFLLSLATGYVYVLAIPVVLWWLFDVTQIAGWVRTLETEPAAVPSAS
jgi:TM2 domain-containing membrane protein YozV